LDSRVSLFVDVDRKVAGPKEDEPASTEAQGAGGSRARPGWESTLGVFSPWRRLADESPTKWTRRVNASHARVRLSRAAILSARMADSDDKPRLIASNKAPRALSTTCSTRRSGGDRADRHRSEEACAAGTRFRFAGSLWTRSPQRALARRNATSTNTRKATSTTTRPLRASASS